jgi:uncharacterized membrane protein YraQ (UPF0718 family)
MRGFFWILVGIYVLLYFYAVYLYEAFSVWLILALLVAIAVSYWMYQKKDTLGEQVHHVDVDTQPLSIWQSPFPYIGITAVGVLIWVVFIL